MTRAEIAAALVRMLENEPQSLRELASCFDETPSEIGAVLSWLAGEGVVQNLGGSWRLVPGQVARGYTEPPEAIPETTARVAQAIAEPDPEPDPDDEFFESFEAPEPEPTEPADMAKTKVCNTCGERKPLTAYSVNRALPDGHSNRCKAEALRAYAKQANNRDAEVQFAEIKVRAEIKCGELLRDMAERGERAVKGSNQHSGRDSVSLPQLGVTAKESERFQQAAAAPPEEVEQAFAEARRTQVPVTSAQVRALTKSPDFTPDQRADHERLWRVLRALEQISDQDISAEEWLEGLPDYMRAKFSNHLEKARPWLQRLFDLWDNRHAN